jgi:DNA-binding response OmpR family regulator
MNENSNAPEVLVIEDDIAICHLISDYFTSQGYRVSTVNDGPDALQFMKQSIPDLILLDLALPTVDGFEILQEVRSNLRTATIPVIIITAVGDLETMASGFRLGADEYIVKPFNLRELEMRAKLVLARTAFFTPVSRLELEYHIFISYSRKDMTIVQKLCNGLRARGLRVWGDEDDLEPGTSTWEHAIGTAIRNTGCVIAIMSPDAERSVWVSRELAMAEIIHKRIFPILVSGSEADAIPFRLMSHQWIDGRQNYNEAFEKLVGAVKKYLGVE